MSHKYDVFLFDFSTLLCLFGKPLQRNSKTGNTNFKASLRVNVTHIAIQTAM